jgi:iron complex outermembrane receptor protein
MTLRMTLALAGASALAMATSAFAEGAKTTQAVAAAQADPAMLGEIVVTARRKSENLQNVPQVVNVVTADAVQKLNIQRFQDISAVVPGLSLDSSGGYLTSASMRGVTFNVDAGAPPTVAFYLNDAPAESNFLFQSLFDVGQVEVLRGPQGTTRGVSAPSGAITVTTHRPDLEQFGGYADVTLTDLHGRNAQGAINLPIIKDVLALRVAGVIDQNDTDGVRSIHNSLRPSQKTGALRTSVRFEPSDQFQANVTYQHLDKHLDTFTQVSGPGGGDNGPAITPEERLAVQDGVNDVRQHMDAVIAQIDGRVAGQHLSYVGGYFRSKIQAHSPQDLGDILPGGEIYQNLHSVQWTYTQELRIASEPAPGRFFDYTAGVFYSRSRAENEVHQTAATLPGAFGPLFAPADPAAFNSKFTLPVTAEAPGTNKEISGFGSITLHLGSQTEFTAGGRYIVSRNDDAIIASTGSGFLALPAGLLGLPSCAAAGYASTYPGSCDVPTTAVGIQPGVVMNSEGHQQHNPIIYNFSLSHHFSRDLLGYVTVGSGWRRPPGTLQIDNATNDPTLNALTFLQPERSRSYEVGLKTTFLDQRGRLNVALYRQTYDGLIYRTQPVPYLDNNGAQTVVTTMEFNTNAPATIKGFDVDAAFQVTRNWNISLAASYADGRLDNALIPCRDSNFDGVPDTGSPTVADFQRAGKFIALCSSNGSTSRNPYWSGTLTSEYVAPLRDGVDGFVRGLFTYYPENNRHDVGLVVGDYGLLNLYTGVRSEDGAWEVALFAKNAFQAKQTLSRDFAAQDVLGLSTQFGSSGYYATTVTPQREVGVNVRYAFGSR